MGTQMKGVLLLVSLIGGAVENREDGRSPKGTPGIVYGAVSSSLL
jgi:hypothetical protein